MSAWLYLASDAFVDGASATFSASKRLVQALCAFASNIVPISDNGGSAAIGWLRCNANETKEVESITHLSAQIPG